MAAAQSRAQARQQEKDRRRTLTRRLFPAFLRDGGLRTDLFGDPACFDSDDDRGDDAISVAGRNPDIQAVCLRLSHIIYGHVAWLRALYRRMAHRLLPASSWAPTPLGDSENDGDEEAAHPSLPAGRPRCAGSRCLALAEAGQPRAFGKPGPTGPRCHRCRGNELDHSTASAVRALWASPASESQLNITPPRRPPSHIEVGALLTAHGHQPVGLARICKALRQVGIPHSEDVPGDPSAPGPSPQAVYTCPACRGRHRAHEYDNTCKEKPPPGWIRPITTRRRVPRSALGAQRALLAGEAGPAFRPCPLPFDTTEDAAAEAKTAMTLLISQATPYAAAALPHKTPPAETISTRKPEDDVSQTTACSTPAGTPSLTQDEVGAPHPDRPSTVPTDRPSANMDPRVASPPSPSQPSSASADAASGRGDSATASSRGTAPTGPPRTDLENPDDEPGWSKAELRAALAASLRSAPPQQDDVGRTDASTPSTAPLTRHADPFLAPPPVLQPFEIAFPDSLPRRAPGLAAVLLERAATLMECGMTMTGPGHWRRQNQCLYLSLAAAAGALPGLSHKIANDLRRTIEGAVRRKKPHWADRDFLGQEVGAFADFLLWGMQDTPLLRDRAVAVYDARTGTCEVFRSPLAAASPAPVLALWFSGAHYRWVRWAAPEP